MPTLAPNPTSDLDWALRNIGEQLVAVTRANPALLDDLPLNIADAVTYARTLMMLGAA